VPWHSTTAAGANWTPGVYEIAGVGNIHSVSVGLSHVSGPGTFPLGVESSIVGGHAYVTQGDTIWSTRWVGYGGEAVITTLTSERIAGTFHFEAARSTGTEKSVTQGTFDVPITSSAGTAAGDTGHRIQGDVQGPFLATNAALSWPAGANPTLSVSASAGLTTLLISLEDVSGTGTYALDTLPPLRSITIVGRPGYPAGQWRTDRLGGSGTATVTSVTPQRIQGTFSATVVPTASGTIGPFPVSGTFDMGRAGP
jgi:hypothetical protein